MSDAGGAPDGAVVEPDPESVVGLDGLTFQLDRLRRRHARRTGAVRPLGLERLAQRCGIPRSTLHTYLSGAVLPPPTAIDALVLALGATAAEARQWAAATERVADAAQAGRARGAGSPTSRMRAISAALDTRMDRPTDWPATSLHQVALLERVQIGTDRESAATTMRVAARATVSGVDRYFLRAFPPPEFDLDALDLVDHVGCRNGVHRSFDDLRARVLEVVLDGPLERGEVSVFSFTIDQAASRRRPGEPTRQVLRNFRQRGPTYSLAIAFPDDDLPAEVRQVHVPHAFADDTGSHPLRLSSAGVAQMAVDRPPAGMHGIRWEWATGA